MAARDAQERQGINDMEDCTFLYFKPTGKWKYGGRGTFPDREGYYEITHDLIFEENNGMPGIISDGKDLTVIVIPDDDCKSRAAFPRMIKAVEAS